MNQQVPPGWYPNEYGHQQWWDGYQWGPLAPPPPPTPQTFQPPVDQPTQREKSSAGEIISGIGCLAVIVLVLVVFVSCSIGSRVSSDSNEVKDNDYSTIDWESVVNGLEQKYLDAIAGIFEHSASSAELNEAALKVGYEVCKLYGSGHSPEDIAILVEAGLAEFDSIKPGAGQVIVSAALEHLC